MAIDRNNDEERLARIEAIVREYRTPIDGVRTPARRSVGHVRESAHHSLRRAHVTSSKTKRG